VAEKERIKPYANSLWMPWGLEIVPEKIARSYQRKMQELDCAVPETFHYYTVQEINDNTDTMIDNILREYFKQQGLFACTEDI